MLLNCNEPETRGVVLALQTTLDDLGKGERRAVWGGGKARAEGARTVWRSRALAQHH